MENLSEFTNKLSEILAVLSPYSTVITSSIQQCVKDALNSEDAEKSLEYCKILLDLCWEKLNTGHWKDVHVAWRYLYSCVSMIKALVLAGKQNCQEAIKACDMGLIMGAPVIDNILASMASELHKIITDSENSNSAIDQPPPLKKPRKTGFEMRTKDIERVPCLDVFDFQAQYLLPQKPVIITGALKDWPASSKWSVPYICSKAKHRTVPIEVGSRYTEDNWSQTLMTLGEFVQKFMSTDATETGYLAQHELFNQITDLAPDFEIPDYCFLSSPESEIDVNAWFGPGGTVSPMHQDPRDNILAQVFGRKYVKLVDIKHTASVYPFVDGILTNTSQVDVENPDYDRFPLFKDVPFSEFVLEPGELLFIPKKWWHYVKALDNSFSISFWFGKQ